MKPTIVLISPLAGIYDSVYKSIPLCLLAVARSLDLDKYDVKIIDQKISGWKADLMIALKNKPLLVGITALTGHQLFFGSLLSKDIKKFDESIPILWGGIHASAVPKQMLKEDYIDYVSVGEGESVLSHLVDALHEKKAVDEIPGLGYKKGSDVVVNDAEDLMPMDIVQDPPYHLIDMNKYLKYIKDNEFYVEGARGCLYDCTFCYNPQFNQRKWRPRGAKEVIANMKYLKDKYGITNFFVVDDSFFTSQKRVDEFVDLLEKEKLNVKWSIEANAVMLFRLTDDVLERLASVGLSWISIGVESGSEKVRKFMHKPIPVEKLLDFNIRISKHKIKCRYNFVTGTPLDTKSDVKDSVNLALTLLKGNPHAMVQPFYIVVPYPGTVYGKDCKEFGFIEPTKLSDWFDYDSLTITGKFPWLKTRLYELVMYTSFFIDAKLEYHLNNTLLNNVLKLGVALYRPIAKFRFKNLVDFMFIEGWVLRKIHLAQRRYLAQSVRL